MQVEKKHVYVVILLAMITIPLTMAVINTNKPHTPIALNEIVDKHVAEGRHNEALVLLDGAIVFHVEKFIDLFAVKRMTKETKGLLLSHGAVIRDFSYRRSYISAQICDRKSASAYYRQAIMYGLDESKYPININNLCVEV